ncbi:YopX family protein [Lysinibacillus sphaericus]|uniref:YopX family protein n=1 Tax=Lysinibacillus sphaericus TaxID=1421 RepID=UPI002E213BF1|nr:YopX family protein [Lysinibacillus sphaericus]
MRETKYRAWDKKLKEMFPVHELVFNRFDGAPTTIKGYTHDEKDVWNVHGGHFMKYANAPRYELLEYTGLKDKNGSEVYEMHVVKVEIPVVSVNEDFIGKVKMYEGRWWVDNGNDAIPLWSETNEITVLGNIYENPELLEESL